MNQKAIFLDKDGTLIPDIPYNVDPAFISLSANAVEGLLRLQAAGFLLVVLSNQPGIGLGYFTVSQLQGAFERIRELCANAGIVISGFYYCPHSPGGKNEKPARDCECRKPRPGLLLQAAAALGLNLSKSWMIGDILNDVEAGNTAGCKTILISNGNETEWLPGPRRTPGCIANNLNEAAAWILTIENRSYEKAVERGEEHSLYSNG